MRFAAARRAVAPLALAGLLAMAASAAGHTATTKRVPVKPAKTFTTRVSTLALASVTVEITSPGDGSTVSGVVPVRAQVVAGTTIARVVFSVDGVRIRSDRTAPYTASWDTTVIADGTHRLTAAAVTKSGSTVTHTHQVTVANAPAPVPAPDTTAPSTPTGLTALGATQGGFTAAWTASTDNVGVTAYRVTLDGSSPLAVTGTSQAFSGLACGTAHTVAVAAVDAAGNASGAATIAASTTACPLPADTLAPTTPSGLTVSGITQSGFTLTWTASTDNVAVTGYRVARNGGTPVTVTTTSQTFASLTCATSHTVSVAAVDGAGNASAAASMAATTAACPTPPPPSGASLFLSPSGSDTAGCTVAAPCRSMDRAYRLASTGTGSVVVEMAGGGYPGQTINPDPTKTTDNDVIFRPAAGARVTIAGEVRAVDVKHVTLSDMSMDDWYLRSADDITIKDVDTIAGYVNSSSRVHVLGGDFGPNHVSGATHVALLHIRGGGFGRTRDVTVDGAYFHDQTRAPGEHAEAVQIWSADDVTLRNSKFKTCAVYCIFVANIDDPVPSRNVLIENNWFSPGADTAGSQGAISYWAYGLTIRNNSFSGRGAGPNDPAGYPSQNVLVTGNVGFQGPCNNYSWNTYSYNVWEGRTCSATDRNAPAGFVDAAAFDLHLRTDSAAIDGGNPFAFPAIDLDGDSRPMGGRSDAGADERL